MTLSLPADKCSAFWEFITEFSGQVRASKQQLEHLAGKLNQACKVIYEGSTFLHHILDLMKTPMPCIALSSENWIP